MKLFKTILAALALFAFTASLTAQVVVGLPDNYSFYSVELTPAFTNYVPGTTGAAPGTTNAVQTAVIDLRRVPEVSIQFESYQTNAIPGDSVTAGAGSCTLVWKQSVDGVTYSAGGVLVLALSETNKTCITTNIQNPLPFLKFTELRLIGTNAMTSVAVKPYTRVKTK